MLSREILLAAIALLAILVNIPLGRLRAGVRKYSFRWFLYIHLAIPVIAGLRIGFHFGYAVIPVLLTAAVAGQVVGGRTSSHVSA